MKTTLLITVLVIIGFSSVAKAECAWVLWRSDRNTTGRNVSEILDAYPKYDQCKAAQKDWLEQQRKGFEQIKKEKSGPLAITGVTAHPFIIIVDYEDGSQRLLETICLPDTIDPRK